MLKKYGLLLMAVCSVIYFGGVQAVTAEEIYYNNPIGNMTDIGDPYILKDDGKYYMYATSAPGVGFLAPEVIKHGDTYYMSYSARNQEDSLRIAIATSDSPTGPFVDANPDLISEEGSYIDGHFFIDDDGTPYFYYVKDNYENVVDGKHVSHIYVQEMADDLLSLVGEPQFLLEPDHEWEDPNGDYQWNEGPFVIKHEDRYYLMYSANFFAGPNYAVGYAVSDNPMGPFEKSDTNPILTSDLSKGISGPGHNSVTKGFDDETLYIVYHIHTDPNNPSGNRRPAMDRLYFEDGELKVDGPTSEEVELK